MPQTIVYYCTTNPGDYLFDPVAAGFLLSNARSFFPTPASASADNGTGTSVASLTAAPFAASRLLTSAEMRVAISQADDLTNGATLMSDAGVFMRPTFVLDAAGWAQLLKDVAANACPAGTAWCQTVGS